MSKISIGLPVYNGERFLRSKIESILNQTHTNFELIISDNCSTDQTQKICEEYVRKDNRIKYYHQEKDFGLLDLSFYLEFSKKVELVKSELIKFFNNAKQNGKKIVCYLVITTI